MPGVFRQICQDAAADSDNPYLLVIDEVNRANIAKVFGELITLIEDDKRLGAENEIKVTLPYSGESFGVPNNLTILGTMNTADRSIALLDIALRRRFTFVPVMPNPNYLKTDIQGVSLQQLLQRLNERIARMLDKDHQIGHSYFMNITNLADLRFVWKHRILPLLEEYFYSDGERLHALLGDKFVILQSMDGTGDNTFSDRFDFGTGQYGLPELSDETFVTSLQELAGQSSE
jgi:5-methylcytosine-specific restriction protein B